jgi:pimeloyl-ACP methyl ester carboxylesterase
MKTMPYAAGQGELGIYYEVHGSGPTVVFIHGGNGNTLSWIHQIPYFSRDHQCIAIDLRGFKNSKCPIEQYEAKYMAADLLAVLDHAGITRAALVCQSLGAWAGLPVAVRHPERVSAIVINGSPTPVYSERNWALMAGATKVTQAIQRGELPRAKASGMSEGYMREQPVLTYLYEAIGLLNGPRRTETMMDDACKIRPEDFKGYAVPTLLTGGQHDHFLTPDHHIHIASLIPSAQTHTFQHSGHSAYWEEPDEFNRIVLEFLTNCGWSSAG